jgi:hypothetical protein
VRVVRVGSDDGYAIPEQGFPEPYAQDEAEDQVEPDYPLVLVTWHDAWFDFDQEGPDTERADYLVRTVGFLVSDGTRFVSIAQEILPDGDGFRAVTHIPRSIIESITPLAENPTELHGAAS